MNPETQRNPAEEAASVSEARAALADLLERISARNNMSEEEAMKLAIEAQKEYRSQRRSSSDGP